MIVFLLILKNMKIRNCGSRNYKYLIKQFIFAQETVVVEFHFDPEGI